MAEIIEGKHECTAYKLTCLLVGKKTICKCIRSCFCSAKMNPVYQNHCETGNYKSQ